ncbi:MAG: XdhC family protein [Caulobacteraceae bacterium]|nr:XdhC family protein [Caulobacteraceae bacterium]
MSETLPSWPLFGLVDDIRPALARAAASKLPLALATIVDLDGGGPRPVGDQMSVTEDEVCGFLSGGCLEADVVTHARELLADSGPSRRLVYGQGSPWADIRLLCGARIEILLERIAPDDPALATLLQLTSARQPALWLTDGERRACGPANAPPQGWQGAFARPYDPQTRLIVMGGDPTALAIAALGVQNGFETTLVRPKGPVEPPPIPGVAYSRDDPAAAFPAIGLDPWTAVAVASHEAALDHEGLVAALPSKAFYVGALGARRRLEDRRSSLAAAGIAERDIDRMRAPIGLDIGGKAPFEIAVAVLAEITALRHAPSLAQAMRSSGSTSTTSPAAAAGAPAGRRSRASASANTATSEES